MIAVCTAWYNDPSIIRMIESIPSDWDIILSYGLFTNCKAKEDIKLLDKVRTYRNVRIVRGYGLEVDIRNRYMEEMSPYDNMIMIDSDEYIMTLNREIFELHIQDLEYGLHMVEFEGKLVNGRFFVTPEKWRYHKSHKFITDGTTIQNINTGVSTIQGILLGHDENMRPQQIKDDINEYQKQLWAYESLNNIDTLSKVR